jgi:hypothetical protein
MTWWQGPGLALAALSLASACADAPRSPDPGAATGSTGVTSRVTARGVELCLPQPGGGDVVISGDSIAIGPGSSAALTGGVRVRAEGGMAFEATAARASLAGGGRIAVLAGGVRAVLSLADAGASND